MGSRRQSSNRLVDYGPPALASEPTVSDGDFIRWLRTGGSRSNGPLMSNGTNVLFVGGPWDGVRKQFDHLPSRFYVDVLTKVSDDINMDDGTAKPGPMEAEKVAYAKIEAAGQVFYKSLPSKDWRRYPTNELGVELFKGYKNLA